MMVASSSYQMTAVHIVAAAIDMGITPEAAAIILTLTGITNTLGRLTFGGLANRIGNKTVLVLCLVVQALSLFSLSRSTDLHALYIIATVYGLAYGGLVTMMPTMAGALFGTKSIGATFGAINGAYTAGAATGPFLAGYIFDVTGSYTIAFASSSIAVAMAFVLCLRLKPLQRKAPTT